jgi:hypothetical protein
VRLLFCFRGFVNTEMVGTDTIESDWGAWDSSMREREHKKKRERDSLLF